VYADSDPGQCQHFFDDAREKASWQYFEKNHPSSAVAVGRIWRTEKLAAGGMLIATMNGGKCCPSPEEKCVRVLAKVVTSRREGTVGEWHRMDWVNHRGQVPWYFRV